MSDLYPTGVQLIAAERHRQITSEGWTPEHDDEHDNEELARAAVCYALPAQWRVVKRPEMFWPLALTPNLPKGGSNYYGLWPWEPGYWKPTPNDRIRELVKAGALIAAEIDRLQRLAPSADDGERNKEV